MNSRIACSFAIQIFIYDPSKRLCYGRDVNIRHGVLESLIMVAQLKLLPAVPAVAFVGVAFVDGVEIRAQADLACLHLRDDRADRPICHVSRAPPWRAASRA